MVVRILFVLYFIANGSSYAQESPEPLIKGDYIDMEVDPLGNIYLLNQANVITKFDKTGRQLFEFSLNRMGQIYSMDVSNPQKILVYYGDYNYIIFLDSTMSELSRLSLEDLGFWNIPAVCMARDGQVYIYDIPEQRILKINRNGNISMQTNELYSYISAAPEQCAMFELENHLYFWTPATIFRFDNFGQLLSTIEFPNRTCRFTTEDIYCLNRGRISSKSLFIEFEEREHVLLERDNIKDFHLEQKSILLLDARGVHRLVRAEID